MTVTPASDLTMAQLEGRQSGDPLAGIDAESSVRIVDLEPGSARTAHRHPLSEEIVVVVSGTGVCWIDGIRHEVGSGDVVRIPAGAAHATIPATPMRLHCFFPHPDLDENMETTDIDVTEHG